MTDEEKNVISAILQNQSSHFMETIKNEKLNYLHDCCKETFASLEGNYQKVCEESKNNFSI